MSRTRDHRKNQEVGLFIGVFVNPLSLSAGQVTQYQRLFLDAIEQYRHSLSESEENKPYARYVDNPDFSLILELKKKVEAGQEVSGGKTVRLLELVLSDYLACLRKLMEKPWSKTETIQTQIDLLAQVTRAGLLSIEDQLNGT